MQELVISLSGDASIKPPEKLELAASQQALVTSGSSKPFSVYKSRNSKRKVYASQKAACIKESFPNCKLARVRQN
eukprot:1146419-Pelagomonas_calceolata.AAC.7